jgi:CDP-diacylglycerol---serine O-phosphatidyltransferase
MSNNKFLTIIPTTFTSLNLTFGFLAILVNQPVLSCLLILAGALMDIFDGMAARMLNATSEWGKQLDSLADLVTFGIAPAFLFYNIIAHQWIGLLAVCCLPVGVAFRLARFNLSTDQKLIFKGLPSPPNGLFFAAFPLLIQKNIIPFDYNCGTNAVLYLLPVIFAVVMNLNIPVFSTKSLKFGLKHNIAFLVFIIASIMILAGFLFFSDATILLRILGSIPFIITAYLLISLLFAKQVLKTANLS